jgi:hypothetical protein
MKTCLIQIQISLVHSLENVQLECGNVLLKMGSYIKTVEQNGVYFFDFNILLRPCGWMFEVPNKINCSCFFVV